MATEHAHAASVAAAHDDGHEHPGWSIYWKVAVVLFVITGIEVSAFYIPAWETSWVYVPSMLFLSTIKFFLVVKYYMHLGYDHRLFRSLFVGPLIVAALTLVGLMFLFSKLSIELGLLR